MWCIAGSACAWMHLVSAIHQPRDTPWCFRRLANGRVWPGGGGGGPRGVGGDGGAHCRPGGRAGRAAAVRSMPSHLWLQPLCSSSVELEHFPCASILASKSFLTSSLRSDFGILCFKTLWIMWQDIPCFQTARIVWHPLQVDPGANAGQPIGGRLPHGQAAEHAPRDRLRGQPVPEGQDLDAPHPTRQAQVPGQLWRPSICHAAASQACLLPRKCCLHSGLVVFQHLSVQGSVDGRIQAPPTLRGRRW